MLYNTHKKSQCFFTCFVIWILKFKPSTTLLFTGKLNIDFRNLTFLQAQHWTSTNNEKLTLLNKWNLRKRSWKKTVSKSAFLFMKQNFAVSCTEQKGWGNFFPEKNVFDGNVST